MEIDNLLTQLLSRIPELEWQLNKISTTFSSRSLPPGLFNLEEDAPIQAYMSEIKSDISRLANVVHNNRSERFLALKINQKINVLVMVCSRKKNQQPSTAPINFGIQSLSTRSQWLQSLESTLLMLNEQKEALANTLTHFKGDATAQLKLKQELGDIEKRLTLAEEAYSRSAN